MVSAVALLVGSALLCWPGGPARPRLRALAPARPGWWSPTRWMSWLPTARPEIVALAAGVAAAPVAGVGGSIAGATVAGLVAHRWRTARHARRRTAQLAELINAVGLLVAELRVGAHPAAAAAAAASTGDDAAHRVLDSVAAGALLGAGVPVLLRRHAAAEPAIADGLGRLASAWEVAERHGVALAELVDAVRVDLDARLRIGGELRAQLAGPRVTAVVLAGLPVLGVLLGEGVGAGPLRVLTDTGIGQVLLVTGTALACAGMAWSDRIMAAAVRT